MFLKRRSILLLAGLALLVLSTAPAAGEVVTTPGKVVDLGATVLDTAVSADGQRIYVLTPGQVLVYSSREGRVTDRIAVGKEFDGISLLANQNILVLSSSAKKSMQMLGVEFVQQIDVAGLPFRGAADAAVTVVVFSDYQ